MPQVLYCSYSIFLSSYFALSLKVEGFPGGSAVKNLPAKAENRGLIPPLGRSPEKEMAILFSILAWEIPRIEEPGGLQCIESQIDMT